MGLGFYQLSGGWVEALSEDHFSEAWLHVSWPDYNSSNGVTRIATGDIDSDGKDEIITGLGPVPGSPSIFIHLYQPQDLVNSLFHLVREESLCCRKPSLLSFFSLSFCRSEGQKGLLCLPGEDPGKVRLDGT